MFNKIKNSVLILVSVLTISACQSPKEKALVNIKKLETEDSIFSPRLIEDLKKSYLDFANKYPDDEKSPDFIFKAAQQCTAIGQYEKSINLLQSIVEKYPKDKRSEEASFLEGFIYENNLKDYAKAKAAYLNFIAKFPKSELADDAKIAIENLGKSPEEIFKSFKNKNNSVN